MQTTAPEWAHISFSDEIIDVVQRLRSMGLSVRVVQACDVLEDMPDSVWFVAVMSADMQAVERLISRLRHSGPRNFFSPCFSHEVEGGGYMCVFPNMSGQAQTVH